MRRLLTAGLVLLVVVILVLPTLLSRLTARPVEKIVTEVPESPDSLVTIKVYFPDTHLIQSMPLGEYLKSVVAAEMPADFEDEALKAQMVAARTFAVRRIQAHLAGSTGGCPLSPQADICADPNTGQAYMSREQANDKLGFFTARGLWRRLEATQQETDGMVIRYHGKLIDPLYHAVSGSFTEDAGEYFSESLPYLKSVDDHWGADSPKLTATVTYTAAELVKKLSAGGKEISVSAVASATQAGKLPVQITARTATKRVKAVSVGATAFSGREFREKLGLHSTNFSVAVSKGSVVITTKGDGHGVGMSQYGANGMAKEGKDFKAILTHYYTDVTLGQIFDE